MSSVKLELQGLSAAKDGLPQVSAYAFDALKGHGPEWDRVVKASHLTNCWYQQACNFNLYVNDGVVLREEQAGNYPERNDPDVPDFNPRGCQKGTCYAHRMYEPTRVKYPLKREGKRGEGKWQRVGWDQALTEIADTLIDVVSTEGPDVIVQGGGTRVQNIGSEGLGTTAFFYALGAPIPNTTADNGDDHQGVAVTLGKVIFSDSADNWFYADMILVWGGNPAFTNIANYHFLSEARYHGAKIVVITPDYNASAVHADQWVPVNVGTDAALALAMAQVIVEERLYKEEFVREQTDLPLLVRTETGRFIKECDLQRGGSDEVFAFYDTAGGKVVKAPKKSLALNGLVPSLSGEYVVETIHGRVKAQPVMEILRQKLNAEYTPEQASNITGVPPAVIRGLAREFAAARGVVKMCTANWGKFYHGDLVERATLLLFALCGHMGRKGASYNAFAMLALDTALGGLERHGDDVILGSAGSDPRFARWREEGFTDEMILYEYVRDAFAAGSVTPTSMLYYFHGGLLEASEKHNSWDPHLKRPVGEYLKEAFAKGWQAMSPPRDREPRVMFAAGGNFLRRARSTTQLLQTLLPKLRLIVTLDWRMSSTGLYSDYILPVASWYERDALWLMGMPVVPWAHLNQKATEPLGEAKSEWELFILLARKIEERARERGTLTYRDAAGKERRLDQLEDKITFGGLYNEEDEEGLARDAYLNALNVEVTGWEEFQENGIAPYTGVGKVMRSIGNACDIVPGEPVVPLTWHTEKKEPYPTLTRRMQFYIDQEWYLELGEALPVHKEMPKAGGDHPLRVTGGHARWSVHSDWIDDSLLLRLQRGGPVLFMSQADARARGIEDGQQVEAYNDVGSFRAQVVVAPAVRPGQVVIYHAWENFQFPKWDHFKRVMPSPLNPIELVGGYFHIRPIAMNCYPGLNDRGTRVEVRKADT